MSKMGVENSIFVRLLIQRTSTKNFYLIPSPQPAVRVLYLVRLLYPVRMQSMFYTDRLQCLVKRGPDGVLYGGQLSGGERSGLDRIGRVVRRKFLHDFVKTASRRKARRVISRVLQICLFGCEFCGSGGECGPNRPTFRCQTFRPGASGLRIWGREGRFCPSR